ncbi:MULTISPECIES: hypothetical protein [Streptomyces]|nr:MULTISPECIES: hypothetical protein [Streptomyces]
MNRLDESDAIAVYGFDPKTTGVEGEGIGGAGRLLPWTWMT